MQMFEKYYSIKIVLLVLCTCGGWYDYTLLLLVKKSYRYKTEKTTQVTSMWTSLNFIHWPKFGYMRQI